MNSDKPVILLVDDEESILDFLSESLNKWRAMGELEILTATDIDSAWKIYSNEKPNILFIDINLRGGGTNNEDGIELIKKIREEAKDTTSQIAVLSGQLSNSRCVVLLKYDCSILTKPMENHMMPILIVNQLWGKYCAVRALKKFIS